MSEQTYKSMTENLWFGTLIKEVDIDVNIPPLIDYAYQQKKNGVKSLENSTANAWQSPDLKDTPVLDEFKEVAFKEIDKWHKIFKLQDNQEHLISNIWFNINPKGGFNTPHNHPGAIFSGVFYLQCNKESGDLCFTHPGINQNYHFNGHTVKEHNNLNSGGYTIPPRAGLLVMFPSYQYHYVKPNLTDQDRIVIAFNTIMVDREKYDRWNNA